MSQQPSPPQDPPENLARLVALYAGLSAVNQAVLQARDAQTLLERVCQAMVTSGCFDMVWIGQVDSLSREVRPLASAGDDLHYLDRIRIVVGGAPEGEGPTGQAIHLARSVVCKDWQNDPRTRVWREAGASSGWKSSISLPIREASGITKALTAYSRDPDFFQPAEIALLEASAADIAFALEALALKADNARTREILERERALYQDLVESQPGGIFRIRAPVEGPPLAVVDAVNDEGCRLLGLSRTCLEEAPDRALELIHPTARAAFDTKAREAYASLGPLHWEGRLLIRGRTQWILLRAIPRRLPNGDTVWTGVFHDVTEQHSLSEALAQSQKLESLGSLAGGVAHDINNVLAAILGMTESQLAQLDPASPTSGAFQTILKACLRGRDHIRALLDFARATPAEQDRVQLNQMVQEVLDLLRPTIPARVSFRVEIAPDHPTVIGDAGALSHALMNLCVNAIDAMPNGGQLLIRTDAADGEAHLSVEDTGEGMPPETLARALDPFFTTKPQGKGTGLGLPMVFATARAHGGRMDIRSEVGQGTRVLITLPLPKAPEIATPRGPSSRVEDKPHLPAAPPPPSLRRILVVDDDELVLGATCASVKAFGYEALPVRSGEEALQRLDQGEAVDLVILDLNMPGLGGGFTLARIRATHPRLPILLTTGSGDARAQGLLAAHTGVALLPKPFVFRDLKRHVENLIQPA